MNILIFWGYKFANNVPLCYKKHILILAGKIPLFSLFITSGVSDYNDLLVRYDQNQKQYDDVKKKLKEREDEILSLQQGISIKTTSY